MSSGADVFIWIGGWISHSGSFLEFFTKPFSRAPQQGGFYDYQTPAWF